MIKVIVYGNTVISKMIYYDALERSDLRIVCFTVDREYLHEGQFMGLPQIDFAEIDGLYPPADYGMLAVMSGFSCMRSREKMYLQAKSRGYRLINYISPRVDITPEVQMGENNIILGSTHIGIDGRMGNNNLIRQNVYLGHDFILGSHNFISAGSNIGGHCQIKNACYIGIGATVSNNLVVEEETLIGAGSVVIRNTEPYSKNVGNPSRILGYHQEEGIKMSV